jgi:uncharacterized protein YbaR (Trm112 family)
MVPADICMFVLGFIFVCYIVIEGQRAEKESELDIPKGYAVCPVCNGERRVPYEGRYASVVAGFDPETRTIPCQNCGGQTMMGEAKGYTTKDPATGLGCRHLFHEAQIGNCYHRYTCQRCKLWYDIDSGD